MTDARVLVTSAIALGTFVVVGLLPVTQHSVLFWTTAALTYVGGDTLTTTLIRYSDAMEERGPATRWLCGPNPTFACALLTRLGFFAGLYGLAAAARVVELGMLARTFALFAAVLPVAVTMAGVVGTVWNLVGFWQAR